MSTFTKLTKLSEASREMHIDDNSKIVFFSDCHRGDNSKADNFAPNRYTYMSALDYYYSEGYTYIEIGDGDELWENRHFSTLFHAHKDVYLLMQRFHREGRLYMIWGNHDILKGYGYFVRKNLYEYYDPATRRFEPLFDNIKVHEGLILRYCDTPHKILVAHGHQGDVLNDQFWPLACFLVRYIWRNIECFGFRNNISPARNLSRMYTIEDNFLNWIKAGNRMLIAGHTHNPAFARPGAVPYFNSGSCVYKGYITCIEIQNGEITLVKWSKIPANSGIPNITREIIAGPARILDLF